MAKSEPYKAIPAVGFSLERPADGKCLLMERQNSGFLDGYWSVPRGHVEPGEHVIRTIIREAGEELGITVKEEDIHFVCMHHYRRSDGHDGLTMYFKITAWEGEPTNREPRKCARIQWFARDDLPSMIDPEVIEAYFRTCGPSAFMLGDNQPRIGEGVSS